MAGSTPHEEVLHGGIGNAGAVVRRGEFVLRPTSAHSPAIHALLRHCHDVGFDGVPEVVGIEPAELGTAGRSREQLVFVPGDVPLPPFPTWSQTDAVLASTAALLRRYHDAVVDFTPPPDTTWSDEMVDWAPGADPVICHNDVCPENVVYRDGAAVVLLDFEFAAPGRRTYDLASFARMCVPIETDADAARTGRGGLDAAVRLAVVADAYGLDADDRAELLEILSEQFDRSGEFVRRRMERGEQAFIDMWNATGGAERYVRRRRWFAANRDRFAEALSVGGARSGPSRPTTS